MTDVHDLLARTHRALGDAGVTLDDARHDALLTGIRRRRRRRHAAEALGAGALVLVLGTGGWLGLQRDGSTQPARPALPTATADPSPGAGAAPDASGQVSAVAMPPGTLEASTPGWVLTVESTGSAVADGTVTAASSVHRVDVIDPAGTRYRVLDRVTGPVPTPVRWDAGSTEALVTTPAPDGAGVGRLDLLTGEITPLEGLSYVSGYLGRTAAGEDLWEASLEDRVLVHDGTAVVRELPLLDGALLDPAGTTLAGAGDGTVVTVDVTTGLVTDVSPASDVPCRPLGWRGSDVVVTCEEFIDGRPVVTAVLRFDTTDPGAEGKPLEVPADRVPTGAGLSLPDGRIVVRHTLDLECARGWGVLDVDAGTLEDLPVPVEAEEVAVWPQAVAGDAVLVTVTEACSGDGGTIHRLRYTMSTDTWTHIPSPTPAILSTPPTGRR